MSPTLRTAFCPVDSPFGAARSSVHPPHPSALAYSLTLPGDPLSAGIARSAVRTALRAHALERFSLPAQLAVTELIATTSRLNPGGDVYLSLRYRSETLRLVFWDQRSHHQDPDAESVCAERRRQSLWLLAVVVDDWGGEWGTSETHPPHQGTKSWVLLPR